MGRDEWEIDELSLLNINSYLALVPHTPPPAHEGEGGGAPSF